MTLRSAAATAISAFTVVSCSAPQSDLPSLRKRIASLDSFPKSWLTKQTSVSAIEDQNGVYWNETKIEAFPGSEREKEWAAFKSLMSGERQIWQWKSPLVSKDGLHCFLSGFCILENNKVISLFEQMPTCQQTK
jgi:hypothetical protein